MTQIIFPSISVPIISASSPIENSAQKVLFIGSSSTSGSEAVFYENVPSTKAQIETLFGVASPLSQMLSKAREINAVVQFDAIELPDDGTAATATVIFNTPAADQTISAIVGGADDNEYSSDFLSTNTDIEVATFFTSAINADTTSPVTADNSSGTSATMTLTYQFTGDFGNHIPIRIVTSINAVPATVTGFAGGVTGTVPSDYLDLIDQLRYQTVVFPYGGDDLDDLVTFMDSRFNVSNDVLDGVVIYTGVDTFANLDTAANAFNSQSLVYIANDVNVITTGARVGDFSSLIEVPWIISAKIAAIRSLRLQDGTDISGLTISSNGALDAIGGAALASKPYANTPITGLEVIDVGFGFTALEVTQLEDAGATVIGNNKARNSVIMGQTLTTYKTDTAGNVDTSFKFLNYVDTASTGREYFFNNLSSRYAQSRLTDGNLIKGRDMTNETEIRATMTGYYNDLSESDYVVSRSGEDALNFFKSNLSVSADLSDGSVTMAFSLPIVTQLRSINAPMQLTFNLS